MCRAFAFLIFALFVGTAMAGNANVTLETKASTNQIKTAFTQAIQRIGGSATPFGDTISGMINKHQIGVDLTISGEGDDRLVTISADDGLAIWANYAKDAVKDVTDKMKEKIQDLVVK